MKQMTLRDKGGILSLVLGGCMRIAIGFLLAGLVACGEEKGIDEDGDGVNNTFSNNPVGDVCEN